MTVEDLKYALQNYHHLSKWIERANLQIEEIDAKMIRTSGSIAKKPVGSFNREKFLLASIEKKDKIRFRISNFEYLIDLADDFIIWLPDEISLMVIDKYIKQVSKYDLENTHFYTSRWIRELIYAYIEKYINKM